MADLKISELTNLTAADPVSDMLPIVDVSATPPASGSTKRISINNLLSSSPTASGALTVTGLVTAGSATITGDLTVDTSTLKVDSTNNRVGIGTASPTVPLYVTGNNATATAIMQDETNGAKLRLIANSINFDITNGGGGGDIAVSGANPLTFRINSSEAMRLNSTANLVLKGGTVGATGVGVTFPAAQIVSSDSNCLDDYEEGTFTVTVGGTTTNGTATYAAQNGFYTKIGRLVQIQIYVSWSAGTATGNQTVLGLPFTSSGTGNNPSVLNTYAINIALTAGSSAASSISSNSSLINLFQLPTGGGPDNSVPCDAAGTLIITGTYFV